MSESNEQQIAQVQGTIQENTQITEPVVAQATRVPPNLTDEQRINLLRQMVNNVREETKNRELQYYKEKAINKNESNSVNENGERVRSFHTYYEASRINSELKHFYIRQGARFFEVLFTINGNGGGVTQYPQYPLNNELLNLFREKKVIFRSFYYHVIVSLNVDRLAEFLNSLDDDMINTVEQDDNIMFQVLDNPNPQVVQYFIQRFPSVLKSLSICKFEIPGDRFGYRRDINYFVYIIRFKSFDVIRLIVDAVIENGLFYMFNTTRKHYGYPKNSNSQDYENPQHMTIFHAAIDKYKPMNGLFSDRKFEFNDDSLQECKDVLFYLIDIYIRFQDEIFASVIEQNKIIKEHNSLVPDNDYGSMMDEIKELNLRELLLLKDQYWSTPLSTLCRIDTKNTGYSGRKEKFVLSDRSIENFLSMTRRLIDLSPEALITVDMENEVPLHNAVYHQNNYIIPTLLDGSGMDANGNLTQHKELADQSLRVKGEYGFTPIHQCDKYDAELIRMFIKREPELIAEQSNNGGTILSFFCLSGETLWDDKKEYYQILEEMAKACPRAIFIKNNSDQYPIDYFQEVGIWSSAKIKVAKIFRDVLVEKNMYEGQFDEILNDRKNNFWSADGVPDNVFGRLRYMSDDMKKMLDGIKKQRDEDTKLFRERHQSLRRIMKNEGRCHEKIDKLQKKILQLKKKKGVNRQKKINKIKLLKRHINGLE